MAAEENIITAFFSDGGGELFPQTIVESHDNLGTTTIANPGKSTLVAIYTYGASQTHINVQVGDKNFVLKSNAAAMDFGALVPLNMNVRNVGRLGITVNQ